MNLDALGKHLILELKQCDKTLLNDLDYVKDSMMEAARTIGATILDETFHKFSPLGVTGVVAIAESHLTIHTWPEYAYAAVDIFSCSDTFKPQKAAAFLKDRFGAIESSTTEIARGILSELASLPSESAL
ncbi:MAG: S-adenosylmethionine decarboxylase [Chloroflexi bacterium]|jgi:S-adenosylmethionine decarboxylase|nr:MAG: S-adenosylmethionine decarboxylase [Chloroflexota bacterium]